MGITETIDDTAKEHIALKYIYNKYQANEFTQNKYNKFVYRILMDYVHDKHSVKTFGDHIAACITCVIEFNLEEGEALKKLKNKELFSFIYERIKDTQFVQKLLSQAKVVHVVVNDETGETTTPTFH